MVRNKRVRLHEDELELLKEVRDEMYNDSPSLGKVVAELARNYQDEN